MKKACFSAFVLTIAILLSGCGSISNADTIYCFNCGKRIPADSKYCSFCGASITGRVNGDPLPELPAAPKQTKEPRIAATSFGKKERTSTSSFKSTQTTYNVFDYEVEDCIGCSFNYMASRTDSSATGCTGTRDVYVRDSIGEYYRDDSAWIYVGSFEYDSEGQYVKVDLKWYQTDVYAMAVVRSSLNSYCSFSASWGDEVTLYSYQ